MARVGRAGQNDWPFWADAPRCGKLCCCVQGKKLGNAIIWADGAACCGKRVGNGQGKMMAVLLKRQIWGAIMRREKKVMKVISGLLILPSNRS